MEVQAGQAQQEIQSQEVDSIATSIIEQLRTIFDPRIIDQRITLEDVRDHLNLLTEAQVINPQEVLVVFLFLLLFCLFFWLTFLITCYWFNFFIHLE